MRAIFGLLLIMLGLAMAVVWMPNHDGQRQLAAVTEIATQGLPRQAHLAPNDDRSARTFSPHTPLLASVDPAGGRVAAHTAATARIVAPVSTGTENKGSVSAAVAQPLAAASVVTGSVAAATAGLASHVQPVGLTDAQSAAQRAPAASSMPKEELIRNLQRELKRVGCYHGDVDGSWGAGSRRAMGAFTDRVNASLPIEQPDFILLTLLKSHNIAICGKDCPAGQAMSDTGRCMPNAVVARNNRSHDKRIGSRSREGANEPSVATTAEQPVAVAMTPRWTASVRREAGDTTASTTAAVAAAGATIAAATSVTPLPGRMAMGGPQAGAGAYIAPPLERSPAREAVRAADQAEPAKAVVSSRQRARRTVRGGRSFAPPELRLPLPTVAAVVCLPRCSPDGHAALLCVGAAACSAQLDRDVLCPAIENQIASTTVACPPVDCRVLCRARSRGGPADGVIHEPGCGRVGG